MEQTVIIRIRIPYMTNCMATALFNMPHNYISHLSSYIGCMHRGNSKYILGRFMDPNFYLLYTYNRVIFC
uniref:Uncharacterized protein n=1 Tax=Rhizophora mucronata TaxID=61149 RepID=A0A2P2P8V1_RHIMU